MKYVIAAAVPLVVIAIATRAIKAMGKGEWVATVGGWLGF